MGLFKRTKKEETIESSPEPHEEIKVKSPEEIQKEQLENELRFVQEELESKTNHLNVISEKLDKVKVEYDELVGTVMAAKREANEKRHLCRASLSIRTVSWDSHFKRLGEVLGTIIRIATETFMSTHWRFDGLA